MAISLVAIVLAALMLLGLVVGVMILVLLLVRPSLRGSSGGWRQLVDRFPATKPPLTKLEPKQTAQIGMVVYNRCVELGVEDAGLYVRVRGKSALIPWKEFHEAGHTMLHWQNVPVLNVGDPPITTITVPVALLPAMQSRLPMG